MGNLSRRNLRKVEYSLKSFKQNTLKISKIKIVRWVKWLNFRFYKLESLFKTFRFIEVEVLLYACEQTK